MWSERLIYISRQSRQSDRRIPRPSQESWVRTHPIVWLQNCIFLLFSGWFNFSFSCTDSRRDSLIETGDCQIIMFSPPSTSHSINNNYKTIEIFQIIMASKMYRLSEILKGLVISTWNIFLWLKWAGQCPVGEPFPHSSEIDTVSVKIEK